MDHTTSREEETRCSDLARDDDVEMSVAAHEVEATTNLSAPRTATSIAPSTTPSAALSPALESSPAHANSSLSDAANVVVAMATRLIWARLHEVEHLQAKLGEPRRILGTAVAICDEVRASVDSDVDAALALGSVHLQDRVEVLHANKFADFFSAFMSFFLANPPQN